MICQVHCIFGSTGFGDQPPPSAW